MQMQSTYWLEKVLKMISLYVNALLRTLWHIVIPAMQLSGINSENCTLHLHLFNFLYRVRDLRPRWSTRRRAGFSCATLQLQWVGRVCNNDIAENSVILWRYALLTGKHLWTFRKNPSRRGLHGSEDESMRILCNIGKYLAVDKAKYHRGLARLDN